MATISLLKFGRLLGSNTVLGMAKILGVTPPPPPISIRALVESFGLPLQPTDLKLFWDLDVAGQIIFHPPDATGVPLDKTIQFDFRDPANTPVRKATSFELDIKVAATGQEFGRSPFSFVRGFGTTGFQSNTAYSWNVLAINDFGRGPGSPTFTFQTAGPPPPPPPPHPETLTLRISLASFGQQRSITSVAMAINGPGAPTGTIPFQLSQDRLTATAAVSLPSPPSGQSSVSYTVFATVAFHYDGLIDPNSGSISGPEDAQVDLAAPTSISWTGQSRVALFSVSYSGFSNVFNLTFEGLL